jgi:hypothetical protein
VASVVSPVKAQTQPADLEVLAAWAPELADTFVALSCDIALVIDAAGRIVTLAQHDKQPIAPPSWVGSAWVDTVSPDSRAKVEQTLADVAASGHARRREINHPGAIGGAAPVAYSAARLGVRGPTLAVGHDLRAQAAMQQRFVAAQEALERSYWNAHRHLQDSAEAPALMTDNERASLGLGSAEAPSTRDIDDSELVRALGRLVERIGQDELQGLLRDARRLAERHFLARAAQRAGGFDALARSLDPKPPPRGRRKKIRPSS